MKTIFIARHFNAADYYVTVETFLGVFGNYVSALAAVEAAKEVPGHHMGTFMYTGDLFMNGKSVHTGEPNRSETYYFEIEECEVNKILVGKNK